MPLKLRAASLRTTSASDVTELPSAWLSRAHFLRRVASIAAFIAPAQAPIDIGAVKLTAGPAAHHLQRPAVCICNFTEQPMV
jgi:hypothetical protein